MAIFRKPFRPIRIIVDSGDSVNLHHPEMIVGINQNWLVVEDRDGLFITEPEKVTAIQQIKSHNGSKRR